MNRIFQFVLFLLFSFIFISCNNNPIDGINTKYYTVSGAVFEHVEPGTSPNIKKGAPVVLDNDTSFSNSYGEYSFNKVTAGNHIISVSLSNYEPYLDTITVFNDTIISIHLFGTIQYYTVSGTVYDYIDPGTSPIVKKGAPVVLDNDISISNSYGEYSFNKVTAGNHIISVSLSNYEPYVDTITVFNDTTILIPLFGIKGDYFPIQLNTHKRFKYEFDGGFSGIADSGESLWSFDSLKEENGNHIYSIKETLIYSRNMNGGNPQLDTLIRQFNIIENNSHQITIGLSPWSGITFNRYYDHRLGEIIKLPLNFISDFNIWIKKNVGLYKMQASDGAHLSSIVYELIE